MAWNQDSRSAGTASVAAAVLAALVGAFLVGAAPGHAAGDELRAATTFTAAAEQPDGKIVVAGTTADCYGCLSRPPRFVVARYRSDGRLDRSFGQGDGYVTGSARPPGRAGDTTPEAVIVEPDGDLLIGGFTPSAGAVLRFKPDGSSDANFGSAGVVMVDGIAIRALALQPDGRVIAAGSGRVARFAPNGAVDQSWGVGGVDNPGVGADTLEIQPDGKVIVGGRGFFGNGGPYQPGGVARLRADGTLDSTFGSDGVAEPALPQPPYGGFEVNDLSLQADGKILAGGNVLFSNPGIKQAPEFALVRYTPEGVLDQGFGGGDGRVGGCVDFVAAQDDGTILGALSYNFYLPSNCVGLISEDGQRAIKSFGLDDSADFEPQPLDLQPDGTMIFAGLSPRLARDGTIVGYRPWVARYSIDTRLDRSFGLAFLPEVLCRGRTATREARRWVENPATVPPEAIGTPGRDVILGTADGDEIDAGGGSDLVCGGRGADRVHGRVGPDTLLGGPGSDRLFGGDGNDNLIGGPGDDFLRGGAGLDRIAGRPGRH